MLQHQLPILLVEPGLSPMFTTTRHILTERIMQDEYLGPAALMQAYRWMADSRVRFSKSRA